MNAHMIFNLAVASIAATVFGAGKPGYTIVDTGQGYCYDNNAPIACPTVTSPGPRTKETDPVSVRISPSERPNPTTGTEIRFQQRGSLLSSLRN